MPHEIRSNMGRKYKPLQVYLQSRAQEEKELTLSFQNIEKILGSPLPASAFKYREWWSNQSDISNRPQASAWINAGYIVDGVHQERNSGWVLFKHYRAEVGSKNMSRNFNVVMDWRDFQKLARDRMSEHFGTPLNELTPVGIPKRFDLVSEDGQIVGDAKYLTLVRGKNIPPAKFMEIAGHVWLLENTPASRRFLVFGNQREVPEWWLKKYGAIIKTVEFYFLSNQGELEKLK